MRVINLNWNIKSFFFIREIFDTLPKKKKKIKCYTGIEFIFVKLNFWRCGVCESINRLWTFKKLRIREIKIHFEIKIHQVKHKFLALFFFFFKFKCYTNKKYTKNSWKITLNFSNFFFHITKKSWVFSKTKNRIKYLAMYFDQFFLSKLISFENL